MPIYELTYITQLHLEVEAYSEADAIDVGNRKLSDEWDCVHVEELKE